MAAAESDGAAFRLNGLSACLDNLSGDDESDSDESLIDLTMSSPADPEPTGLLVDTDSDCEDVQDPGRFRRTRFGGLIDDEALDADQNSDEERAEELAATAGGDEDGNLPGFIDNDEEIDDTDPSFYTLINRNTDANGQLLPPAENNNSPSRPFRDEPVVDLTVSPEAQQNEGENFGSDHGSESDSDESVIVISPTCDCVCVCECVCGGGAYKGLSSEVEVVLCTHARTHTHTRARAHTHL